MRPHPRIPTLRAIDPNSRSDTLADREARSMERSILLIEDDEDIRKVTEMALQFTAGYLVQADIHLSKGIALSWWPQEGTLYHGLTLMATEDNHGAERLLSASLEERPNFEGYLALAEIQINQGKFEEAARNLILVEDCEPLMSFRYQAGYLQGLAELRQDHREAARLRFQELLKINTDNQRVWLALGYLEVLEGNPGQARIYYGRALEIIDRKLGEYSQEQGLEAKGMTARLQKHRQVAVRALESVS
jgi:tetratricopeptide (TPR) repeat protein